MNMNRNIGLEISDEDEKEEHVANRNGWYGNAYIWYRTHVTGR